MVSLASVSPVAAALVVLIVVVASVPVRSPGCKDEGKQISFMLYTCCSGYTRHSYQLVVTLNVNGDTVF